MTIYHGTESARAFFRFVSVVVAFLTLCGIAIACKMPDQKMEISNGLIFLLPVIFYLGIVAHIGWIRSSGPRISVSPFTFDPEHRMFYLTVTNQINVVAVPHVYLNDVVDVTGRRFEEMRLSTECHWRDCQSDVTPLLEQGDHASAGVLVLKNDEKGMVYVESWAADHIARRITPITALDDRSEMQVSVLITCNNVNGVAGNRFKKTFVLVPKPGIDEYEVREI